MPSSSAILAEPESIAEILNGVPLGIVLLDRSLCVLRMNRFFEALTGYSEEDALGVPGNFIIRSDLHTRGQLFRQILESGESHIQEGTIINCHRKKLPILFTISSLHDSQGEIAGLIVVLEDLSSLHHAERNAGGADGMGKILGHSPKMQEVFELIPVLARTDASLLITGETGTGKDMIAEVIHQTSKRARHPFIKINCGALPESLLESELFGHVRGAFTGAVTDKPGIFLLAQDGTIFLTEIGDLPLSLQVKLLTVLDDREFYPVGGSKKVKVNVRVIAATHRSLREQVREGLFREDLFYRLNVLRIHLPPLREREGDIRLLLDHFLRDFVSHLGSHIKGFTNKSLDLLLAYSFPGNIRELRNIVEYAANICPGEQIAPEHLPKYLFAPASSQKTVIPGQQASVLSREEQPPHGVNKTEAYSAENWSETEREMILDAMKKTGGNRTKAARLLGWGRTTLWRKLKTL
ncbi:MAG: sigma 54-interacting transcriptional regulator [Desulfocapsaceae bacterium]|nr:sigma 54-interacting transcriptional regulator [Desulfocapsaceae bacterium]